MLITDEIAAHLYAPADFYALKPGDWVFLFRIGNNYLDGAARPEQVVRNKNGQITTKSGRTFACYNGYGSELCVKSRRFRLCCYSAGLKQALRDVIETQQIMIRIAEMDFAGMALTLAEAKALELQLQKYSSRRTAGLNRALHRGRVVRAILSGQKEMPRIQRKECVFYHEREDRPGVLQALLGKSVMTGNSVVLCEERWYQATITGQLEPLHVTDSQTVALLRAVKCRRLVTETRLLPST